MLTLSLSHRRRPRLFRNHDFVLLLENLNDSASVSGMMHWLGFNAGIETVYMSSGIAWVLMSDDTLTLLFPLMDVKIVFLNSGFNSSPLFIYYYGFPYTVYKLLQRLRSKGVQTRTQRLLLPKLKLLQLGLGVHPPLGRLSRLSF